MSCLLILLDRVELLTNVINICFNEFEAKN